MLAMHSLTGPSKTATSTFARRPVTSQLLGGYLQLSHQTQRSIDDPCSLPLAICISHHLHRYQSGLNPNDGLARRTTPVLCRRHHQDTIRRQTWIAVRPIIPSRRTSRIISSSPTAPWTTIGNALIPKDPSRPNSTPRTPFKAPSHQSDKMRLAHIRRIRHLRFGKYRDMITSIRKTGGRTAGPRRRR
jgi:hypothetical protein